MIMATEIYMPQLGLTMVDGTVIRWLFSEGARVKKGEPILEIETDKAIAEVESPSEGILKGICAEEGDVVPVGQVVAFILQEGENIQEVVQEYKGNNTKKPTPAQSPEKVRKDQGFGVNQIERTKVMASPVARTLAKQMGIELSKITGTGPEGRITREDVEQYAQTVSVTSNLFGKHDRDEVEWLELSTTRRITAERMSLSAQSVPQFHLSMEIDLSEVVTLQAGLAEGIFSKTGKRLSYTAMLIKVVAEIIKDHPLVNARFIDGRIGINQKININIAIGNKDGLITPVIRRADQKSLSQIVLDLDILREKSATLRFTPDELEGGTFTISNLGMYGIDEFSAILNPPQSAILAIGNIARRPFCLSNGEISSRPTAWFTLTVDHRVLDGLVAAQFLNQLKQFLANSVSLINSLNE